MADGQEQTGQSGGPAVDRGGNPVVDPTKNVLDVVEAAVKRIDDLRGANIEIVMARLEGSQKVIDSEFDAVRREFSLIESRRVEQKTDTKVAVDAALSAAKDAVKEQAAASEKAILKSETAAAEQSRQNAQTFTAALKGVTDGFNDLKDRVGKLETRRETIDEKGRDTRSSVGMVVGLAGAVFAFLSISLALFTMIGRP